MKIKIIRPEPPPTPEKKAVVEGILTQTGTKGEIATLENAVVRIEYRRDRKEIFVRDLKDVHNEPALVTRSKRGLETCWLAIQRHFNMLTEMNLTDVRHVMTEHKIKSHYWCMMD